MITYEEKLACSEAYCAYCLMTDEEKKKVSPDYLNYLERNKSDTIEVNLNPSYPLYIQQISNRGWEIINKMVKSAEV